jgi:hypothetical protein
MLANASFANKADLRWVVRWTGGMTLVLVPAPSVDSCAFYYLPPCHSSTPPHPGAISTLPALRRFLLTPGPADKPLCCKILRSGGGLLKGSPQHTLLVEQEGGKTGAFLVAARKRKGGPGGATYVLSVSRGVGYGLREYGS